MIIKKIKLGLAGILLAGALSNPLSAQEKKTEFDKVYSPLDFHYETIGIEKQKMNLIYPQISNSLDKQVQNQPINFSYKLPEIKKQKKDWFYYGLEASLIGLNVADFILTTKALKTGRVIEANPLVRPFADKPYLLATGKVLGVGSALYLNRKSKKDNKKFATAVLIGLDLVYGFVVYHNSKVISKL